MARTSLSDHRFEGWRFGGISAPRTISGATDAVTRNPSPTPSILEVPWPDSGPRLGFVAVRLLDDGASGPRAGAGFVEVRAGIEFGN